MGFFSRHREEPSTPKPQSPQAGVPKAKLPDPGLERSDPRQLIYGLIKASGLSIVAVAAMPVEALLDRAVTAAPALRASTRMGASGWMVFEGDPETLWTAAEGPDGSALIITSSPSSDSRFFLRELLDPLKTAPGVRVELFTLDEGPAPAVQLVARAEAVAPFDLPRLRHLMGNDGYPFLPISVRRGLGDWERLNGSTYRTTRVDADGDELTLMTSVLDGEPVLYCAFAQEEHEENVNRFSFVTDRTHALEWWDPTVLVRTGIPVMLGQTVDMEHQAQALLQHLTDSYARQRERVASDAPTAAPRGDLWTRVEGRPGLPNRPVGSMAELTGRQPVGIAGLRFAVPKGADSFERVSFLSQQLMEATGSGFAPAVACGEALERPANPDWLCIDSIVVDPASGRIILAARPSHVMYGMDRAFDYGAANGRNLTWAEHGHGGGLWFPTTLLYVGSLRSRVLVPWSASQNIENVDYHAGRQLIGVLEFLGNSTFAVAVVEAQGTRRLLTVVEGLSGNETVRFSPAGDWLLVTRWDRSLIVDVQTGQHAWLQARNAVWWPEGSALLAVDTTDGVNVPQLYDLSTNAWVKKFPRIMMDRPALSNFPTAWAQGLDAEGRQLLIKAATGVTPEFQHEYGTGDRMGVVDLETGQARMMTTFLDREEQLERFVEEARWTTPPRSDTGITLDASIRATLDEPVTEHEWLAPERWADQAREIYVRLFDKAVEAANEGEGPGRLLPELLCCLIAMAKDASLWNKWSPRMNDVSGALQARMVDGRIQGEALAEWQQFCSAVAALDAGTPEVIDLVAAAQAR